MFIAPYVDDIMLFTLKTSQQRNIIKKELMEEFKIKDLGTANHILGMTSLFTDADRTANQVDHRSYTGYLFVLESR